MSANSTNTALARRRKHAEERVVKIASWLRIGSWALLIGLTLSVLFLSGAILLAPTTTNGIDLLSGATQDRILNTSDLRSGIAFSSKIWSLISIAAYSSWALYVITRLHLLFGNFKSSQVFTRVNVKLIRSFGYALIFQIFLAYLVFIIYLVVKIVFFQNGIDDLPDMKFSINGEWIMKLMMFGTIFLFAWILDIGCDLYNENEYTI